MKLSGILLLLVVMAGCASTQEKYIKSHPELSQDERQAVLEKTLTHGLTKEAVRTSLGKPQKTHGYTQDGKLMELWVYSEFQWHPYESVLFQEGKVVGWNFPKSVKRELDTISPDQLLSVPLQAETETETEEKTSS